jgi:transcriptional regulator with XRE-family HTH domain
LSTGSNVSGYDLPNYDPAYGRITKRHMSPGNDAWVNGDGSQVSAVTCDPRETARTFKQMDTYEDPAAARRRLQRELRKLRTDADLTQRAVAEEMEWSPSKVIRIESGGVGITTNDLKQLLAYYKVKDQAVVDDLLATNRESRKQSWSDFKDVLTPAGRTYWGYEASAVILRQFEPSLIPGLLQTEEYTRALLPAVNVPRPSDEEVDRLIEARAARQTLLERTTLPELFFIVDEAALRREVGGKSVMHRQLDRIEELGARERISIQVVPSSAGAYPGQLGSFVLFEFRDDDTCLILESRSDMVTRDEPEEIGQFLDMFQDLEKKVASRPKDLGQVLSKIRKDVAGEVKLG